LQNIIHKHCDKNPREEDEGLSYIREPNLSGTWNPAGAWRCFDVKPVYNDVVATLFYVLCRLGGYNTFDLFQISFGWPWQNAMQRKLIIIIIILL